MRHIGILSALTAVLLVGAGCGDDDNQVCGNGAIEGTEICDSDQTGSESCLTQGFSGGTLSCNSSCSGFDTSLCTTADCGNGAIDAIEECDSTNLDGNDCTDVAGGFTGGTLACAANCTFDTTGCTGGSTCGDGTVDTGEDCDGANLDGNACTDVGNFVGGTLACAGDCSFDTTGCTAQPDCGNGALDTGEDCDGANLNNADCTTIGGGFVAGALACAGDCSFDTQSCLTTSDQLAAARATADGTTNLAVNGAWVTYIRDGHGSDPMGGFHVQAEQLGPALFVQADATTLATLTVGDEISFDITEMDTSNVLRMAIGIANLTIDGSGNDVTQLLQDVSAATDLVSAIDDYECELITLDATVAGETTGAGSGYSQMQIDTASIQGNPDLLLRIPNTELVGLPLAAGCTFSATSVPMWRFGPDAQVGVWSAPELTVHSCPAPEVTGAVAINGTDVEVTLSNLIDPASIIDAPNQIYLDQGVSTNSVVVNGNILTVNTDGLVSGQIHTITVASSVTDTLGTGMNTAANTAQFLAPVTTESSCGDNLDEDADGYFDCLDADCVGEVQCDWASQLYIWEIDADTPGADLLEFVELWNNSGVDVDLQTAGIFLLHVNGNGDRVSSVVALSGTVLDGGLHVAGMSGVSNLDQDRGGSSFLQNGPDGVMLVSCVGCDTSDFPNGFDPTPTAGSFGTANGRTATVLDAIAWGTNDADDTGLMTVLNVSTQWDFGTTGTVSLIRTSLDGYRQSTPDPGVSGIQP